MKICSRCEAQKPFAEFNRRKLSADGYTAACGACIRSDKQTKYWVDPVHRAAQIAAATAAKIRRFERSPAYKRAFTLWGTCKRRTHIPPWVSIVDFVPICAKAIKKGGRYEIDHRIPLNGKLVSGLHVPANCRVVLRLTNLKKGNKFVLAL